MKFFEEPKLIFMAFHVEDIMDDSVPYDEDELPLA